MIVSIVTGTYNRLKSLKRMIDSVRNSVGIGFPYEIVVVDGGSTDGTQEFLRNQSDVVLIEQKELLGAVKAFNEGARSSRGRYVIMANDDIAFKYESIVNAISVLEDDSSIGIGCFPQNRYSSEYTVSRMPAVIDGAQSSTWYGQVCIIPRWLGNRVGWWGEGYHTYGGDNEMSCKVLELGLRVVPLESCCIDDFVEKDELRKINSKGFGPGDNHPDSILWKSRWTRNDKIGPVVSNFPLIDIPKRTKDIRVLYAPIYEDSSFPIQLKTKKGLRESLSKHWMVYEVNYRRDPDLIYYGVSMFRPNLVIIQFHDPKAISYDLMMKLRDEFKDTVFVSWNGDYNLKALESSAYKQVAKLFHLTTFVCMDIIPQYIAEGINAKYWQIGFEDYDVIPGTLKERIDVLFMGNCYTRQRQSMGEMLRIRKDLKTRLYGSWPSHIGSDGNTLYDFATGDLICRSSEIVLGDNNFPDSYAYVSNRLFQVLHSGAFYLQQVIPGMTQTLGLEDGVHLATWTDLNDLSNKIDFWLPRKSERLQIGREGKKFIDRYHSFDARVSELMLMLAELKMGH